MVSLTGQKLRMLYQLKKNRWHENTVSIMDTVFFSLYLLLEVFFMNDEKIKVVELKELVRQFTSSRKWGEAHSPKNLAMSIAIEAAELMEIFQWVESDEAWEHAHHEEVAEHLGEELADVMIYCLSLANQLDIDVSHIISDKVEKNGKKYPSPND